MFSNQNGAGRDIHERELSAAVFETLPFSVDKIYLFLNRMFLFFVMCRRLYCVFSISILTLYNLQACVFFKMVNLSML